MSPIYGEGDQAFIRLQQEIIKTSDDESIFAWSKSGPAGAFDGLASALQCSEATEKLCRLEAQVVVSRSR
jgi:hypothetical protein